jgi:hypothetical protein
MLITLKWGQFKPSQLHPAARGWSHCKPRHPGANSGCHGHEIPLSSHYQPCEIASVAVLLASDSGRLTGWRNGQGHRRPERVTGVGSALFRWFERGVKVQLCRQLRLNIR